ncbi:MAG: fasciclin domain-containing protein [Paludibacteraceae bacterium]|nr:fasciclin domain-containing protein [Paludibacteraceae bacterium]
MWLASLSMSCSDAWENHYNREVGSGSGESLFANIEAQPELSIFTDLLRQTGYDSLLLNTQTYTVWAPINDALAGSENWSLDKKTELVKNHITRFAHPTSDLQSKTIFMLDKKFVTFARTVNGFAIGGKNLLPALSNIVASNGILHVIDGYVPYLSNIWEFIGKAPGLDSLRAYLYSRSTFEFDQAASIEIGTNEFGQAVYDSVISFYNPVLEKIGSLHIEDSVYTALLPDNVAWVKAYEQIKNGYKTLAVDGGDAQQGLNTRWAIVKNLIFKKLVTNTQEVDSLFSTTGGRFAQPSYLFENSTKYELSNGLAYVTDSVRFKAAESWQQPIVVEAENSDYGRSYKFASLYVRSALGSSFSALVSDSKYLIAEPTTVSNTTQNEVTFPIPNVLSGKYRIYCVFVPSSIVAETDKRPYKVSFSLTYINSAGQPVVESAVSAKNLLLGSGKLAGVFTSNASEITKMFVTEIEFPYCNLIDNKSDAAKISTKLRVRNETRITETVRFDKMLRIDNIILEPVQ